MTSCIVGLQIGFLYLFFLVFVPFSFSPDFLSKISPKPLKIDTSNLVYWFTLQIWYTGLQSRVITWD